MKYRLNNLMNNRFYDNIDLFDQMYFFIILIYAAMPINATRNMFVNEDLTLLPLLPISLTIILIIKHKITFLDKKLILVITIFFCWLFLQYLITTDFYLGYLNILGNIIIAYILVRVYDLNMFLLYEKFTITLSIIALIGWFLHIIIPTIFSNFIISIGVISTPGSTNVASIIIYTLTNTARDAITIFDLPRNSGFSWEPGRYAALVILAIYYNLNRNKYKIKGNYGFFILFIALLSTQSTTGYVTLLIILFYIYRKNLIKSPIISTILFAILITIIFSLPFISDKIINLWFDEYLLNQTIALSNYSNNLIMPQRLTALIFDYKNIVDKPILGYGLYPNSYVYNEISPNIRIVNGLLTIFSQYGLFIGLIVYYQLYKSSKLLYQINYSEAKYLFFLIFIAISISYNFWTVPFFMSTWMFALFRKTYLNKQK